MTPTAKQRPRVTRPYGSEGSAAGKPCPTCYAPMELRQGNERSPLGVPETRRSE